MRDKFETLHDALSVVMLLGAIEILSLGAQGCPPNPITPDAGSLGGSPGTGGRPSVGGSSGVGGATSPICTGACCVTCAILASHDCPESHPTALGATCEAVCLNGEARAYTRWPPLSAACLSLACVRKAYTCKGGRE